MRSLFENSAEFAKFFHEFYAPLVLYAYKITGDQTAAEDIAEDAFISLWNKRENSQNIRSLTSYLYTIARNGSLTWLRKVHRQHTHQSAIVSLSETVEPSSLESMIYSETMRRIYKAMDKLPRQCRKVFILHYIEGKRLAEIAEELKISVGTVKTHKVRGIDLLQKALLGFLSCLLFR